MPTPRRAASRSLRVVSLFSGVAGLDLGLENSGHQVIEMCESWEPARRVLAAHFPGIHVHGDVQSYAPTVEYDLLAAGFPCTDLSHAGSRSGIFGKSSGLVRHVFRIAEQTSPSWILLENVPNLLGLHSGAGMAHVTAELDTLGYRWAYRTVDSRFTGVPQRRPRVIILASREYDPRPVLLTEDAGAPHELVTPDAPGSNAAHADTASGFYWTEGRNGLGLVAGAIPTLKGGSTLGLPSSPAVWIHTNPRGRRILLPSIEDGEALQGLPRGWTTAAVAAGEPNLRWKLVGNAVTVGVGQWVGERLAQAASLDELADAVSSDPALAIARDRRWPRAGWGDGTGAWSSPASGWPRRATITPLEAMLQNPTPLSHRATNGFLSRLEDSGRKVPSAFHQDVEGHLDATRPPLPSSGSWASSESASARMKAQRRKGTKPELALRRALHGRGLRYRLQIRPTTSLRRRVGIAFMTEKVAVDVRGCFWHRCPQHATSPSANAERWSDKLDRNVGRDIHTVQTLADLGWEVVVVWEHEDPAVAADRVEAAVLARRYAAKQPTTDDVKRAAG